MNNLRQHPTQRPAGPRPMPRRRQPLAPTSVTVIATVVATPNVPINVVAAVVPIPNLPANTVAIVVPIPNAPGTNIAVAIPIPNALGMNVVYPVAPPPVGPFMLRRPLPPTTTTRRPHPLIPWKPNCPKSSIDAA